MTVAPETRVFFVADVHWRPVEVGAVLNDNRLTGSFGQFLAELCKQAPVDLYIIGDLFDFWFEKNGQTFPFYAVYLKQLRLAVDAGVRILFLFGNRDFAHERVLAEQGGVIILGDKSEVCLGPHKAFLQHGDLFCSRDWRYQLFRKFIRSRLVKRLVRLFSLEAVNSAIFWLRRRSQAEVGRKSLKNMAIVDAQVAAVHKLGFTLVICGHVHKAERRKVVGAGPGDELITLGSWDNSGGHYAVWDGQKLALCRYDCLIDGNRESDKEVNC